MDHNDREQFWKTLCSLPGNDIVAEREQLFKSIKYPKLLFRYRPVSTKSLEALRTNRLYFSSANYYAVSRKNVLIAESRTTERRYIRFIIRTRLMMQPNLRNSLCSVK